MRISKYEWINFLVTTKVVGYPTRAPHVGADMSSAPRRYRICNPVKHLDIIYGYGMSFVGRPRRAAPAGYPHHHPRCPSNPVIFGPIRICTRTAELPAFPTRGSAALHPWLPIFCRYAAKPHALCPIPHTLCPFS